MGNFFYFEAVNHCAKFHYVRMRGEKFLNQDTGCLPCGTLPKVVFKYIFFQIDFQDGGVSHLGFLKFQIFSSHSVWVGQCVHCSKFYQNQSNGCRKTTFSVFQNGGHPPSWISRNLNL